MLVDTTKLVDLDAARRQLALNAEEYAEAHALAAQVLSTDRALRQLEYTQAAEVFRGTTVYLRTRRPDDQLMPPFAHPVPDDATITSSSPIADTRIMDGDHRSFVKEHAPQVVRELRDIFFADAGRVEATPLFSDGLSAAAPFAHVARLLLAEPLGRQHAIDAQAPLNQGLVPGPRQARGNAAVKRGGRVLSPFELEGVLRRHPAVREVVAFATPHMTLDEVAGVA
eukprot:1422232-Prymnesium_polylepis.1